MVVLLVVDLCWCSLLVGLFVSCGLWLCGWLLWFVVFVVWVFMVRPLVWCGFGVCTICFGCTYLVLSAGGFPGWFNFLWIGVVK